MKRRFIAILMTALLALSFAACSKSPAEPAAPAQPDQNAAAAPSVEFTIAVSGIDGKTEFTAADLTGLTETEATIKMTKKDGSETGGTFKGYKLKDVLAVLGASDYATLDIEATDGYAKTYDKTIIDADDTLFAIELDGETNVSIVAGSKGSNWWMKDLAKINVAK